MSGKLNDGSVPSVRRDQTTEAQDRSRQGEPKPRLATALKRAAKLGPRFKTKEELFDALDKAREG